MNPIMEPYIYKAYIEAIYNGVLCLEVEEDSSTRILVTGDLNLLITIELEISTEDESNNNTWGHVQQ